MKNIALFLLFILFGFGLTAQEKRVTGITFLGEDKLSNEGLYFEGERGIDFQYGKRITPHGDCIDVINGFVFVTWYKGGMDKRNLMVSRKKVDGGEWQTIEFPDKHIGFRGDPTIGDSHNTAAIIVCPIDSTVHLLYDMHAYSKVSYPNNYFNYRVTQKGKAFVEDSLWNISVFNAKRHYLKAGVDYQNTTYPGFDRFDDGRIMADFRFGGSGNGNDQYTIYDGNAWGDNVQYNNGNQPAADEKYSIYGGFKYLHGKLYAGASIRYMLANTETDFKYDINNGLFFSQAETPYGKSNWFDVHHNPISIPIQNPNVIKVGEPCEIGLGTYMSSGPSWTVTKAGDIHSMSTVSQTSVHYFKKAGDSTFTYTTNCPSKGDLYSINEDVLIITLEGNRPVFKITPGGKNEWSNLLKVSSGSTYRHCNVALDDDKIFIYAMEYGSGKAQPLTLLTYRIDYGDEENYFSIEAEDYDTGVEGVAFHDRESSNTGSAKDYRENDGVDLFVSSDASNGLYVGKVRPGEWMNYTFNMDSTAAYYLGIRASNISYANAAIDAYLDDTLVVSDLGINLTGNARIFETSKSTHSFVMDSGKHTLRIYIDKAEFNFDKIVFIPDELYTSSTKIKIPLVKVFPNPNRTGIFHLSKSCNWQVYTISGKRIDQGMGNIVNLQTYVKGIFILKLPNRTEKLIFQ